MGIVIAEDDPRAPDVRALLAVHLAFSHEVTPPGHVHALDVDELRDPSVTFFSARRDGTLLGIGALKELDASHGELKSMHTVASARRDGIGRSVVERLLAVAVERGYRRVSLETGTMAAYAPARSLYERMGFVACEPFGEYTVNPYSVCMAKLVHDAALGAPEHAEVRGGRLAFWHAGRGVPLLLVHGWPSTRRIWARNVAELAARGFEVVAPDLRGFGDSECGADGLHDVVAHSLDMAELLRDRLGLEGVVAAGGDLGAAVIQDLSLRFPGLLDRLVVFNGPLPKVAGRMDELPRDERRPEEMHGHRPATEPEALMAELATPEARTAFVSAHYRKWSPAGRFDEADLAYLAEPFADPTKLRASFGTYESMRDPAKRTGRSMITAPNPTRTLILVAMADRNCHPGFGQWAAMAFPDHVGPLGILDAGHFPQWEAAPVVNDVVTMFCADRLEPTRRSAP